MKRLFLTLVIAALFAGAIAQNNNVFWTMRVKVKMDKKLEWEKKAPAFMKAHHPNASFRVYEISTGPNTGSYVLSVGPLSYKDMDAPPVFPKGETSAKADAQALDAICESREITHYRRVEGISDINPDRNNKYARLNFLEIKVGTWLQVLAFLQKIDAVRQKNQIKNDIAYFRPTHSGAVNRFVIVYYLEKLEELDMMEQGFGEMYDEVHGNNAWYRDITNYFGMIKSSEFELWALRPDLSTPKTMAVSSN